MIPTLLLLAMCASAQYAPPDPVAANGAVVVLGNTRVTVLTPTLLRIEVRASVHLPFDDRPTLQVVNRALPVPPFTVARVNATAARITTSVLTLTVADVAPVNGTCAGATPGFDAGRPTRTPRYPQGLNNVTQAGCCAACNADPDCTAWVFAPAGAAGQCWPLVASGGKVPAPGRVFGGEASPVDGGVSVSFVGPGGAEVVWAPGAADSANLNGTYSALDCYSTPMQCNDEYNSKLLPGLLSRAGWAAVDDSRSARLVPAPNSPAGIPTWWSLEALPSFDVYFQANPALDYKAAIGEWASVLGRPAMLPRSAFGVWWSRYHEYSADSFVAEVLSGYANFSIPLNNAVFDMVRGPAPAPPVPPGPNQKRRPNFLHHSHTRSHPATHT